MKCSNFVMFRIRLSDLGARSLGLTHSVSHQKAKESVLDTSSKPAENTWDSPESTKKGKQKATKNYDYHQQPGIQKHKE